jgi:hypothetical protein
MGSKPLPESHFLAESDTLDRRLRQSGMLQEVASRGCMKKRPNPRRKNCHCSRLCRIASRDHDKMQNQGSVEETVDKGRLEQSRATERSGRGSSGKCRQVLT